MQTTLQYVTENERLDFLPSYFGLHALTLVENFVFRFAEKVLPNYGGGHWTFARLILPSGQTTPVFIPPNSVSTKQGSVEFTQPYTGESIVISGPTALEIAGLIVTSYALSHLVASVRLSDKDHDTCADAVQASNSFAYNLAEGNDDLRASVFELLD